MSFFNPELPVIKEKIVSQHPWEKYIKDAYSRTYKYGHNSANNPVYPPPKKEDAVINPNRVKITVIGSRVTKEFIYCMKIAQGLFKYKKQHFDAPVIRAVTSVEWPKVWNDLKIQYGGMAFCLLSRVAVIVNDKFIGGDKEFKQLVETKFSYHICPDYYNEAIKLFSNYVKSSGRPCAFIQINIDDDYIGTLLFSLYSDIVPLTCENFLRLCTTKKGGYAGTPVHRIVKDCWIQCGGFGLKNTDLDCENFIVPHDRRGVLCMANNGRHMDCSTQFFVLLQPAPWMAFKYVAFGQLIDGEETLQKIEAIPTCYESPTKRIIIQKCGVFNMECKDAPINKNTREYIQGHIENLFSLGDILYEALMEKVFLEAEFREIQRLQNEMPGEGQEAGAEATPNPELNIRATQRFIRKKEDIDKHLQQIGHPQSTPPRQADKGENNDFDVEVYSYEPEEYPYKQAADASSVSIIPIPEKPFYIPLTDVPYPGDVDSTYDFKKLLKGDYCGECDIDKDAPKKGIADEGLSYPSEVYNLMAERASVSGESSQGTLDSEDEKEIKKYIENAADRVSFAGDIVRTMAKDGKLNLFENARKSELITDDELRRFRLASVEVRSRDKRVSITVGAKDKHHEIKRRQTGFVRPEDLARIKQIQKANAALMEDDDDKDDDDDDDEDYSPYTRQVSISVPATQEPKKKKDSDKKRQMGFAQEDDLEKVHVFDKHRVEAEEEVEDIVEEEERPVKKFTHQRKQLERTRVHEAKRSESEKVEEEDTTKVKWRPQRGLRGHRHSADVSRLDGFEDEERRSSVLARLYSGYIPNDEEDGHGPTLKDFKPASEVQNKNLFLTASTIIHPYSDEDVRNKYARHSLVDDEKKVTQVLDLQYGKKVDRKISTDYVKTIDYLEQEHKKYENSLRSIEFAKTRPAMSVNEYKKKNEQYFQELEEQGSTANLTGNYRKSIDVSKKRRSSVKPKPRGLRLPGDTPLYGSFAEPND